MSSRVMIGAGAWLIGAVCASGGSLYAVGQLGQALLEQHTKQVSVAMVNAELAVENSERVGQIPAVTPGASPTVAAKKSPKSKPRPSHTHSSAKSAPRGVERLLTSAGGTADAICRSGLVHLQYWSPGQGFDVDRVQPGPSSVATVTFTNSSGGVVMRVTCSSSGVPVAHMSTFSWGGGPPHDE